MKHVWRMGAVALAVAAMFAVPASAQKGDPEAGRIKASTCMGCHGITDYSNVYPTYRVPKIGGQHHDYIVSALQAYKNGTRQHPTMRGQASSLTDEDIADIAAFLSQAPSE